MCVRGQRMAGDPEANPFEHPSRPEPSGPVGGRGSVRAGTRKRLGRSLALPRSPAPGRGSDGASPSRNPSQLQAGSGALTPRSVAADRG